MSTQAIAGSADEEAGTVRALLRDRRAVALLLAATLTILSNSIISPALPGIQAAFAGSGRADLLVPLLVTAPSLMVAIVAPMAGLLADRIGPRRLLLAGVVLFAIAGTAGLWLNSLPMLLGSRLVLGIAVALIMTAQTALIGQGFTGAARATFMGLQIAATNLSGFVFMLLAGWLAGSSPFLPFGIYAVALLYLPLMWIALRDGERGRGAEPSDAATGGPWWIAKLATAALLAGLSQVGFYLFPTQIPFYLAQLGHDDPSAAARVLASVTLAGGLFSLGYGHIRARLGLGRTLVIGFMLFAAGFVLLSRGGGVSSAMGAGALVGAGTGCLFPAFLGVAIDLAPASRRGLASGAITTALFLGQFLSPLLARPLVGAVGFPQTFVLAATMFVLLGAASPFLFPRRRGRAAAEILKAGPTLVAQGRAC